MEKPANHPLLKRLAEITGERYVSDDSSELAMYSMDVGANVPRNPDVVIRPGSTDEVSMIMKLANETKTPVVPRGAGTTYFSGVIARRGGIVVDLTRLSEIKEINEDALTVTVGAGVTFDKLRMELEKRGFINGLSPGSTISATIGGAVSVHGGGGSGPGRTMKFSGVQDTQVVNLKVVLPNGDIITTGTGSIEATKSFGRYTFGPDLTGLFLGSEGTLGIVTEVTLRIYPTPELMAFCTFSFDSWEKAFRATREIRNSRDSGRISNVTGCRLYEAEVIRKRYPKGSLPEDHVVVMPVVVEGSEDLVTRDCMKVSELVSKIGHDIGETIAKEMWNDRLLSTARQWIKAGAPFVLTFYLSFEDGPKVIEELKGLATSLGVDAHVGGYPVENAFRLIAIASDHRDPEIQARNAKFLEQGSQLILKNKLFPITIVGKNNVPFIRHYGGVYYALLQTIKRAIDPNNIMNPGVIFD